MDRRKARYGASDGRPGKPYSQTALRLMKAALSSVLTDAVELDGLLKANPALAITSRKKRNRAGASRPEVNPMTAKQRDAFLAHAALRVNPFQQLFREHLLAQAAVIRGDYAEAYFVQIAPRHNHLVQNSAKLYQGFLAPVGDGQVPFVNIELEQVIEAYGWAGEHGLATALWQRYCDWWLIDDIVRDAVKVARERWQAPAKRKPKAALLPAPKAA